MPLLIGHRAEEGNTGRRMEDDGEEERTSRLLNIVNKL